MASGVASPMVLRSAYRNLYRAGLRAVQYSTPARYDIRDKLRRAFRQGHTSHYNQRRIDNTIEFLNNAAAHKGMEHKIVKHLCLINYHMYTERKPKQHLTPGHLSQLEGAMNNYLENLGFLNESLDLDLR